MENYFYHTLTATDTAKNCTERTGATIIRYPSGVMISTLDTRYKFCVMIDPTISVILVAMTNELCGWPFRTKLYNSPNMDRPVDQSHCIYPDPAVLGLFESLHKANKYALTCKDFALKEAQHLRAIRTALFEEIVIAVATRQK